MSHTHSPTDTVRRIVSETANRERGDAAPAFAILDGKVRRPEAYPVVVPAARDYAATLPGSLAGVPSAVNLGSALDGSNSALRGIRRREHRKYRKHPEAKEENDGPGAGPGMW